MATVVSLDPGGTTGWCVFSVYPDCLVENDISILASITHWRSGQIVGPETQQEDSILELLAMWPGAAVCTEQFIPRQANMGDEMYSPMRLNVLVKWAMRRGFDGVDEFGNPPRQTFTQQPSLAMGTATDARLKDWGLYERSGGQEHARDAVRHGITFLRRAKEKNNLRYRAWPRLYAKDGSLLSDYDQICSV
jgi:hypothetical protein